MVSKEDMMKKFMKLEKVDVGSANEYLRQHQLSQEYYDLSSDKVTTFKQLWDGLKPGETFWFTDTTKQFYDICDTIEPFTWNFRLFQLGQNDKFWMVKVWKDA